MLSVSARDASAQQGFTPAEQRRREVAAQWERCGCGWDLTLRVGYASFFDTSTTAFTNPRPVDIGLNSFNGGVAGAIAAGFRSPWVSFGARASLQSYAPDHFTVFTAPFGWGPTTSNAGNVIWEFGAYVRFQLSPRSFAFTRWVNPWASVGVGYTRMIGSGSVPTSLGDTHFDDGHIGALITPIGVGVEFRVARLLWIGPAFFVTPWFPSVAYIDVRSFGPGVTMQEEGHVNTGWTLALQVRVGG